MTRRNTNMKYIREILRLKYENKLNNSGIAVSLKIGRTTVRECLKRASAANIGWPIPEQIDDSNLEAMLYPSSQSEKSKQKQAKLDFERTHKELKRKGTTLHLLWEEYCAPNPEGYSYSQFCQLYRDWAGKRGIWMPQIYKAGEKMFVDYTGVTMPITNEKDGSVHAAQIFVAVLGASTYVYAEATLSQKMQDFVMSHCRAFRFFGGVPELVIPDNLKSAIIKAHRYEPDENPTYREMAKHYGVVILAARVRRPQDKPLVEQAVQQVERQILAPLRDRQFFNLNELNDEIKPRLDQMNKKPFQKISSSRWCQFEEIDQPALKPLPIIPYEYAQWQTTKASMGYLVFVDEHYYSVPYRLAGEIMETRRTKNIVEIYYKNRRIASHQRSYVKGGKTILKEHMPKSHQEYAECTAEKVLKEGGEIGRQTKSLFMTIMDESGHPKKGTKICTGILRLKKSYGKDRLEAACDRACRVGGHSLASIESILKKGLDQQEMKESNQSPVAHIFHENIRGDFE